MQTSWTRTASHALWARSADAPAKREGVGELRLFNLGSLALLAPPLASRLAFLRGRETARAQHLPARKTRKERVG